MEAKGTLENLEFVGSWETPLETALETGFATVTSPMKVHGVYSGHHKDWEGAVIETSALKQLSFDGQTLRIFTQHHMYEVPATDDGLEAYRKKLQADQTNRLPT